MKIFRIFIILLLITNFSELKSDEKSDILKNKILSDFELNMYIGEPIYLSSLYTIIGKVDGVSNVKKVKIFNKSGGLYSTTSINMKDLQSSDGTYYKSPQNSIFELKYPNNDIRGFVK